MIEFIVLIPCEFFVEEADPIKYLPSITPERDGVHPTRLRGSNAKVRVADTERMGDAHSDCPRHRRLGARERDANAADVVGGGLLKPGHKSRYVVRGVGVMSVHAHNDGALRSRDAAIERDRGDPCWIVKYFDPRMPLCVRSYHCASPVVAHPVHDD